ncbi:MAG TPA: hypothetical protein PLE18_13565 [Candidatus Sumerlaeota bacterium]|nr:hypothetical protein [Candidatus Sumerlaeota bacterium]
MNQALTSRLYEYQYQFDAAGNRTQMKYFDGSTTTTTSYAHNNGNQLTLRSVGGAIYSYDYDANGNMTVAYDHKGEPQREFIWNCDDRLIAANKDGYGSASYVYDALGRRLVRTVGTTSTFYYYDGLTVIAEKQKVGAGNWDWQRIFTVAPGVIGNIFRISEKSGANWTDAYYHYDAIGNVVLRTNTYGGVLEAIDQEAYGNVKVGSQSGYHIHNKEYDCIGELYNYNFRLYDPIIGRFIQPGSSYTFSQNNPSQSVKRELFAIQNCFNETKDEAKNGGACANFADKMCGGNNGDGMIKQCLARKGITLQHCKIGLITWRGGVHTECKVICDGGISCEMGDWDFGPWEFTQPYSTCGRFGIPDYPDPAPCGIK